MDLTLPHGLMPFLDPLAAAIVGGGTGLAVILRTPAADLFRAVAALRIDVFDSPTGSEWRVRDAADEVAATPTATA